jgi:hypothetical protein
VGSIRHCNPPSQQLLGPSFMDGLSIVRFRAAIITVLVVVDRLRRHRRIGSIEQSQLLIRAAVAAGQSRVCDPAALADASPEIATSIVIDAARARFFVVMALFSSLCHRPHFQKVARRSIGMRAWITHPIINVA